MLGASRRFDQPVTPKLVHDIDDKGRRNSCVVQLTLSTEPGALGADHEAPPPPPSSSPPPSTADAEQSRKMDDMVAKIRERKGRYSIAQVCRGSQARASAASAPRSSVQRSSCAAGLERSTELADRSSLGRSSLTPIGALHRGLSRQSSTEYRVARNIAKQVALDNDGDAPYVGEASDPHVDDGSGLESISDKGTQHSREAPTAAPSPTSVEGSAAGAISSISALSSNSDADATMPAATAAGADACAGSKISKWLEPKGTAGSMAEEASSSSAGRRTPPAAGRSSVAPRSSMATGNRRASAIRAQATANTATAAAQRAALEAWPEMPEYMRNLPLRMALEEDERDDKKTAKAKAAAREAAAKAEKEFNAAAGV